MKCANCKVPFGGSVQPIAEGLCLLCAEPSRAHVGVDPAQPGQDKTVRMVLVEEKFLGVIEKWQRSWMNVTGTDEADRKNYFDRAFGIDANMRYDLASRLVASKNFFPLVVEEELQRATAVLRGTLEELPKTRLTIEQSMSRLIFDAERLLEAIEGMKCP